MKTRRPAYRPQRTAIWLVTLLATAGVVRSQNTSGSVGTIGSDGRYPVYLGQSSNYPSDLNGSHSSRDDWGPPPVRPVFFPPPPPPLERVAKPIAADIRRRYPAVEALGEFAAEPFYPALAGRLDRNELKPAQRTALDRYRADKTALQHELRTELTFILQQPAPARLPLLSDLARRQDPKIAELEKRAEALREDLTKSSYSWSDLREWKLGAARTNESPSEIARVMLDAAYFQSGLSAPQRALLREIAVEVVRGGKDTAAAFAAQPYVFFSPSPARVSFPSDMSDSVAAKIARYDTRKSALRKELYDAIYREDSATLGMKRGFVLRALAERQAPEFAILEELAEEIRRELAPMAPPKRMESVVALPMGLEQRAVTIFRRNIAEQKRIRRELMAIQARYPTLRIAGYFERNGFRHKIMPASSGGGYVVGAWQNATTELANLASQYERTLDGLNAEMVEVRKEITERVVRGDPSEVDLAIAEASRKAIEQETDEAIDDYFVAVFEPGLSQGQRRLLLATAVEKLDLPLPEGELQPTRKPANYFGAMR